MEERIYCLIPILIQTHIYQLAQTDPNHNLPCVKLLNHLITKIQTEKEMDEIKNWKASGIKKPPTFDTSIHYQYSYQSCFFK